MIDATDPRGDARDDAEAWGARAGETLRGGEFTSAAARARIVESVRTTRAGGATTRWWHAPVGNALSWGGVAAVVIVAGAMGALGARTLGGARSETATVANVTAGAADVRVVRFVLAAPNARRVSLVGDFNRWDPSATPLVRQGGGWEVSLPLALGRHSYAFVVDGDQWRADPEAPRAVDSDFGTPNSVVFVSSGT